MAQFINTTLIAVSTLATYPSVADIGCLALTARHEVSHLDSRSVTNYHKGIRHFSKNPWEFFDRHRKPPEFIKDISQSLLGEGKSAWGVFLVQTESGPMVLKIISKRPDESVDITNQYRGRGSIDEAILQFELGNLKLGLPMEGLLDRPALDALFGKHPILWEQRNHEIPGEPQWAYLTPFVPEAYSPKIAGRNYEVNPLPSHAREWDWNYIRDWHQKLWQTLHFLEVNPRDFQVIFTRDGTPFVLDPGLYIIENANNLNGPNMRDLDGRLGAGMSYSRPDIDGHLRNLEVRLQHLQ